MAEILNGKDFAKKVRKQVKENVALLKEKGVNPKLAVIMVGHNSSSEVYVRNKERLVKKQELILKNF